MDNEVAIPVDQLFRHFLAPAVGIKEVLSAEIGRIIIVCG